MAARWRSPRISRGFVLSPQAKLLDLVAKRYGVRPSQLLRLRHKVLALGFDIAIALRANLEEAKKIEEAQHEPALPDYPDAVEVTPEQVERMTEPLRF